jgi:ABC-2 type transport system permease protein
MKILGYLLEKEFKQIMRDRFIPKIIFLIPVLQLLILPFAADFEVKKINLGVIDHDHSLYAQRLIEKIGSSGYFRLTDVSSRYDEGLAAIESNASDMLLEIPWGLEKNLVREGKADVLIAVNAINGVKGGLGSSYLSTIIQQFNREAGYGNHITGDITFTHLFNPHLRYKNYMVPGIMVFLLTIIGGFQAALNSVSEKEKGTIEQINVTPIPKYLFILSKLIPFWVIGFLLLLTGFIIAWLVYGLLPVGSVGVICLFAAVYLVAFSGFGLAISSISSTQQQAMFIAFFFIMIFALMSGLFTPISSMPDWAQKITLCNPVRYFAEVMRLIYLKGSHFSDITNQFLVICLFAIAFNILAIAGYRKSD